jgi:hypothetical protein
MSDRSSFLSVLLGGFALVVFTVFMTMITAGFFIYIAVFCVALAAICTFHWLVWGAALSEHLEKERDEERLLERAREEQHADEGRITNRPAR